MKRREFITWGLATSILGIPSSSSESIRQGNISLVIPPVVSAYAQNVENVSRDTILRAGSVLFYGSNSRFPAQGALLKDQDRYYVWTVKHAISALALREHKMGVYIPFLGIFTEDSRRMSITLSQAVNGDDIVALVLPETYQDKLRVLEAFNFILPLQFRRVKPQIGQMVAIPHPETINYSYHRITDINLGFLSLLPDETYANPPLCQGQSGAPVLYVDQSGDKPRLTNQVVGAHVAATNQYPDAYGRLCSSSATVTQLHNRFS